MIGGGPFALLPRVLKQGSVVEEAMLTGRQCSVGMHSLNKVGKWAKACACAAAGTQLIRLRLQLCSSHLYQPPASRACSSMRAPSRASD